MLCRVFDLTLIYPKGTVLPAEIANNCKTLAVSCGNVSKRWTVRQSLIFMYRVWKKIRYWEGALPLCIATGFDLPCVLLGYWWKQRFKNAWWVFCWDPPALSWRDQENKFSRLVIGCVDLIFRRFVRDADRLVLNCHLGLLEEIGVRPRQDQLIPMYNGFSQWPEYSDAGYETDDPWCIGVLSNMAEAKGVNIVLEAFVLLAETYPLLRMLWIGEVSTETRAMIQKRLQQEKIQLARFTMHGRLEQSEAFRRLLECGVVLHPYLAAPSLKWNYPLKLVEYMSMGRAIVAADLPGVRAYIVNDENGLLFHAGSTNDLSRILKKILGNRQEQIRLGKRAKCDAEKFQWSVLNKKLAADLRKGHIYEAG